MVILSERDARIVKYDENQMIKAARYNSCHFPGGNKKCDWQSLSGSKPQTLFVKQFSLFNKVIPMQRHNLSIGHLKSEFSPS